MRNAFLPALAAAMLTVSSGCSVFGAPATADAMVPAECQQLIQLCGAIASEAGVSAADDCVRIANEPSVNTAQYCFEMQGPCAAACGGSTDASADP